MNVRESFWLTVLLLGVSPVWAEFDSGSDGSDGALDCAGLIAAYGCPASCNPCDVEIDLGLAATNVCGVSGDEPCAWDDPGGDRNGDGLGDACDPDIDEDGVANGGDLCAYTPLGVFVDPETGCSIDQLCPCEGPRGTNVNWKNHGKYISCIAPR